MALEQKDDAVLYRGEDKDIFVWLVDEDDHPVSVASASEITALMLNEDGTVLQKKLSLSQVIPVNAGGGCIKIVIAAADSRKLKLGEGQPIEIRAVINSYLTIAQSQNALTVFPSLFPDT